MKREEMNFRSRVWKIVHSKPLQGTIAEWQKEKQRKAFQSKYQFSEN